MHPHYHTMTGNTTVALLIWKFWEQCIKDSLCTGYLIFLWLIELSFIQVEYEYWIIYFISVFQRTHEDK